MQRRDRARPFDDRRVAMPAHVRQRVQRTVPVARDDDRVACDVDRHVPACVGDVFFARDRTQLCAKTRSRSSANTEGET
jgi:hypothetical protein